MTMLEKVAEAMWRARAGSTKHPWSALGTIQDEYRDMARAAIEAMREPSEATVRAGAEPFFEPWVGGRLTDPAAVWSAMIDAIIAEPTDIP